MYMYIYIYIYTYINLDPPEIPNKWNKYHTSHFFGSNSLRFFFGFSVKPRSGEAIDVDFTRPGKHTKNHGKSPCLMDKSTISMAIFMLNYQRIFLLFSVEESRFAVLSLILRTAIFSWCWGVYIFLCVCCHLYQKYPKIWCSKFEVIATYYIRFIHTDPDTLYCHWRSFWRVLTPIGVDHWI